jgi:hypothetical protein
VWLLFESRNESTRPFHSHIEIVDTEKQKQTVAGRAFAWTPQGRMIFDSPLVEAEQDSSIRIDDLTKVGMTGSCCGLPEERLVPLKATRNIAYTDDRPNALHDISPE